MDIESLREYCIREKGCYGMLSLCLESDVSYSLIKELTDYSYNEVRSNKRQKEQYNELSRTYIHRADDIYKHKSGRDMRQRRGC